MRGEVLDANGTRILPNTPYRAHDKVYYYRHVEAEPQIPFDATVLFQDEHLVVADKPHFLPVTPAGRYVQETLLVRLKRSLGIDDLAPVHRIDRDTAGLVLFATTPAVRDRYAALFREREVTKRYEAIASYRAELRLPLTYRSRLSEGASFMQMRETPGSPNAETIFELVETRGRLARYRLTPLTGKKHQLRAHMSALGVPILNDRLYPTLQLRAPDTAPDYNRPLQLLAKSLTFTDPVSGEPRHFESRHELHF